MSSFCFLHSIETLRSKCKHWTTQFAWHVSLAKLLFKCLNFLFKCHSYTWIFNMDRNTCSSTASENKNCCSSVLWEAFPGPQSVNLFLSGLMTPHTNIMILNGDLGPSWHLLFPAVGVICSIIILLSVPNSIKMIMSLVVYGPKTCLISTCGPVWAIMWYWNRQNFYYQLNFLIPTVLKEALTLTNHIFQYDFCVTECVCGFGVCVYIHVMVLSKQFSLAWAPTLYCTPTP